MLSNLSVLQLEIPNASPRFPWSGRVLTFTLNTHNNSVQRRLLLHANLADEGESAGGSVRAEVALVER